MPRYTNRIVAELCIFFCSFVWALSYFNIQEALRDIEPINLLLYRYIIGALVLSPTLFLGRAKTLRDIKNGSILGIILGMVLTGITYGVTLSTIQNAGFIIGSFIAFVPVLVWFVDGKWLSGLDQIAFGGTIIGLWIVTGGVAELSYGDLLYLMAAIFTALHVVVVSILSRTGFDPMFSAFLQCLVVAVLSLVIQTLRGVPFVLPSMTASVHLLILGVVASALCLWLQSVGQRSTSAWRTSLIFSTEPLLTLAVAAWLAGEVVPLKTILGGALILASIVISSLGLKETSPK